MSLVQPRRRRVALPTGSFLSETALPVYEGVSTRKEEARGAALSGIISRGGWGRVHAKAEKESFGILLRENHAKGNVYLGESS
jgi:hypothetical protein